jgi:CRISPR-associated protein Csm3
MENKKGPTRLLVRDAELIVKNDYEPEKTIEIKYSTAINRLSGTAEGKTLRNMERVTPGTKFSFELVFRIFDDGDAGAKDLTRFGIVAKALEWLENDTLGGSGSRGCGKIVFRKICLSGLKNGEFASVAELIAA